MDKLLEERLKATMAVEPVIEAPAEAVEDDELVEAAQEPAEEPVEEARVAYEPKYPYGTVLWAKMNCASPLGRCIASSTSLCPSLPRRAASTAP